jgi:hypothetical protein
VINHVIERRVDCIDEGRRPEDLLDALDLFAVDD